MVRRTKKVGISGRLGARYGVKIRRRISSLESRQKKSHPCPECHYQAVKRVSTGIWTCKHCGYTFCGGAYLPSTAVGESKIETITTIKDNQKIEKPTSKPEEDLKKEK